MMSQLTDFAQRQAALDWEHGAAGGTSGALLLLVAYCAVGMASRRRADPAAPLGVWPLSHPQSTPKAIAPSVQT